MSSLSGKWQIQNYNPQWEIEWDSFIDQLALNSTFLHTRRFLKHNTRNELEDCSFIFLKKGKIAACIPGILIEIDKKKIWSSHARSTYGGLIMSEGVGVEDVMEITQLLDDTLAEYRVDEAIIRNTFRVFNRSFCDEFDYSLWKVGYAIKSREVEIGISLRNKNYETIKSHYENGNKYNIKKAIKYVNVQFSEDYMAFWKLLELNLSAKHGKSPVHNYDDIIRLKALLNEGEIKLIAAFENGLMIGGMVLFDFKNKFLHAQYIASSRDHQHIRPVNAIIDYALNWACENEYEYFNLGTPNEENGRVINLGLSYFKEGFGGRSCLRETMHKIYKYD